MAFIKTLLTFPCQQRITQRLVLTERGSVLQNIWTAFWPLVTALGICGLSEIIPMGEESQIFNGGDVRQ